jgi:hypothetical protein
MPLFPQHRESLLTLLSALQPQIGSPIANIILRIRHLRLNRTPRRLLYRNMAHAMAQQKVKPCNEQIFINLEL